MLPLLLVRQWIARSQLLVAASGQKVAMVRMRLRRSKGMVSFSSLGSARNLTMAFSVFASIILAQGHDNMAKHTFMVSVDFTNQLLSD
jgi:hypothetical protein